MNKDCHLIYESWKEVFSGQQEDRWKELTDIQRRLINAYIDKVRKDFNVPEARQDIRLIGVYNDVTNPKNRKHVVIRVPERPNHTVELDTEHDEIYEPHAHPRGNRERVDVKVGDEDNEMPYPEFAKLVKHANSKLSHVTDKEEDADEDKDEEVVGG